MVTHMKTTVEISDPLLDQARRVAAQERTTLRALLEEGLRLALESRRESRPFKLRDASFKQGRGLQPEYADGRWDRIIDASY